MTLPFPSEFTKDLSVPATAHIFDTAAIMPISTLIISVLSLSHSVAAHGSPKLLGGFNAINSFQPKVAQLLPVATFGQFGRTLKKPRAEHDIAGPLEERNNEKCGDEYGPCAPGLWCVYYLIA
jgi:hypothetical protein